jgi:PAS domain S-box-containing protein/putative nucleotidyltransferase with HDIG domain
VNREHVMSVLYDVTMVIGGEVAVKPLLTKTLQRLLYHTSFPTGLLFLDIPAAAQGETVAAQLAAAVGDYELGECVGKVIDAPAALLHGQAELQEHSPLLAQLPCSPGTYQTFLRLPIDGMGVILLLAPETPHTELPLTNVFQPVMANLSKAIVLCRNNEAYTADLISERDVARRARAVSEERFHHLAAAAQDAIIMLDDDGRIEYWNPSAERLFGYGREEAMGTQMHDLIAPASYRADFARGFEAFRSSGQGPIIGKVVELEALRKDGSTLPIELSVSAMHLNGRWHAAGIIRDISGRKADEAALAHSAGQLQRALQGVIQAIATTIEKRDPYTAGHQQTTARLATAIATEMGWAPDRIEGLRLGAMIHDIGKIYVPAEILSRPGALTESEFKIIKAHPSVGYDIVKDVEFPWPVAAMILQHHERLDGSGYPAGLVGDEIIPEARILSVADVVEAITSHRPYRPALGVEVGLAEILKFRGTLFEPAVVDACVRIIREHHFSFAPNPE